MITIKIGVLPGVLKDIVLNTGATVRDAVNAAELDASGFTVRVDDVVADIDDVVTDGALIALVKSKITGN